MYIRYILKKSKKHLKHSFQTSTQPVSHNPSEPLSFRYHPYCVINYIYRSSLTGILHNLSKWHVHKIQVKLWHDPVYTPERPEDNCIKQKLALTARFHDFQEWEACKRKTICLNVRRASFPILRGVDRD